MSPLVNNQQSYNSNCSKNIQNKEDSIPLNYPSLCQQDESDVIKNNLTMKSFNESIEVIIKTTLKSMISPTTTLSSTDHICGTKLSVKNVTEKNYHRNQHLSKCFNDIMMVEILRNNRKWRRK